MEILLFLQHKRNNGNSLSHELRPSNYCNQYENYDKMEKQTIFKETHCGLEVFLNIDWQGFLRTKLTKPGDAPSNIRETLLTEQRQNL